MSTDIDQLPVMEVGRSHSSSGLVATCCAVENVVGKCRNVLYYLILRFAKIYAY